MPGLTDWWSEISFCCLAEREHKCGWRVLGRCLAKSMEMDLRWKEEIHPSDVVICASIFKTRPRHSIERVKCSCSTVLATFVDWGVPTLCLQGGTRSRRNARITTSEPGLFREQTSAQLQECKPASTVLLATRAQIASSEVERRKLDSAYTNKTSPDAQSACWV